MRRALVAAAAGMVVAAAAGLGDPGGQAAATAARGDDARVAAAAPLRFRLERASVRPRAAFFDGPRRIRVRYRFRAERRVDVVVRVVRAHSGRLVRHWVRPGLAPGRPHSLTWNGRRGNGKVAADGTYILRVGRRGHGGYRAGRVRLLGHAFPVSGPHSYGDRFGEPRSGGRRHEGQDLPSPCGTKLVAARGGRVQARGYSAALYGYWVLIDGRATKTDYFYSHLAAPSPLDAGERIRTGERVGYVGKTGNARSEFCQLHFELWPRGYRNGSPKDPLKALREWDRDS